MMLELDYMATFHVPNTDNRAETLRYDTVFCLLILYVILMPILLMNLLVSTSLLITLLIDGFIIDIKKEKNPSKTQKRNLRTHFKFLET